jgi:hypothetical protein
MDYIQSHLPDITPKPVREALDKLETLVTPAAPAIVKKVAGANRRAAAGAKYDIEALTHRYPETLPPKQVFYRDKGKMGPQKQRSAEQDALSEASRAVQADIDAGNYTPLHDVSQRFYVDPGNYPLVGNTLDNVPTTAKSLAVHLDRARDPEGLGRFESAAQSMMGNPGAEDWYAVGQLERDYMIKYGPELGRDLFKRHFAEAMGSTTGGMSPRSNFQMAQYGNFMDRQGLPIPSESSTLPYPIGGAYLQSNIDTFNDAVHRRGGLTAGASPKRFNFSGSFLGHRDRPPLDKQISQTIREGMGAPPKNAYGVYEAPLHEMAARYGRGASNIQDIGWAGIKQAREPDWRPTSMMDTVNEAIERTARLTGKDPDEVYDLSILGQLRPTFADGGRVVDIGRRR